MAIAMAIMPRGCEIIVRSAHLPMRVLLSLRHHVTVVIVMDIWCVVVRLLLRIDSHMLLRMLGRGDGAPWGNIFVQGVRDRSPASIRGDGRGDVPIRVDGSAVAFLGSAVDVGVLGVEHRLGRRRGRGELASLKLGLVGKEFGQHSRSPREVRSGVLARQCHRRLVQVL